MIEKAQPSSDLRFLAPQRWWLARIDKGLDVMTWRPSGGWEDCQHSNPELDGNPYEFSISRDGSRAVLFHGLLTNRDELYDRFPDSATARDSAESILHIYREAGEGVLPAVKGVFALIVWDKENNVAMLARDQLGIHSLFYAEVEGALLVSDSIDALIRSPGVSRVINRAALADNLRGTWPVSTETFYRDVKRVVGGHSLRVAGGVSHDFLYWKPTPPDTTPFPPPDVALEEFDRLLDQAVDRTLQIGPVSISLSGGIDSGIVALVARDHAASEGSAIPIGLSIAFPDEIGREDTAVAERVGAALGLLVEIFPLEDTGRGMTVLEAALKSCARLPSAAASPWTAAYQQLMHESRRQGRTVMLTGSGGDEWLGTSSEYAARLLGRLDVVGIYRLVKSLYFSFHGSRVASWRGILWTWGLQLFLRRSARNALLRHAPGVLHARWRRKAEASMPDWLAPDPELRRELGSRAESHWPHYQPRWDDLLHMRTHLDNPLVSMEHEEIFEMGRRAGIAVLPPLLDVDLVEFLWRAPVELLNFGSRSKGLARRRLALAFPELGYGVRRKVFGLSYLQTMLMDQGRLAWPSLKATRAIEEMGIANSAILGYSVDNILANGDNHHIMDLWDILSAESWLRPRIQQTAEEPKRVEDRA